MNGDALTVGKAFARQDRALDNFETSGILGFMRLTFAHELIWNMLETGNFGVYSSCPTVDRSGRDARGNGIT